ncbi:hypothetical protein [Leisingera sp. ANG-M1]|uniref:hypothetical protein n=1 Tax=Leisingera sp. ANG-M1 TaxID=1577895 RepID=UPI001269C6A2|nr:hypothetical protein [Leisingera sp. ANG-M1]
MVLASETGFQPPAGQGGGVKSFLPQGSVTRGGNAVHWITPNGCTYSRTQAPGYAPVWYLVQNPHHVGMPNAHRGCPNAVAEGL